jgi:hypothetical protein
MWVEGCVAVLSSVAGEEEEKWFLMMNNEELRTKMIMMILGHVGYQL